MKLYHVTEYKSLKSIKKHGLKLGYDKQLFFAESLSSAYTWLDILSQSIDFDNKAVILQVNLPKNQVNIRYLLPNEKDLYNIKEVIYKKKIQADKIKIFKVIRL